MIVLIVGIPAAGKTTVATAAKQQLEFMGKTVALLDGDSVRQGLNSDLGYGLEDRMENSRRLAEVSRLLAEHVDIVIVAAVMSYDSQRGLFKQIAGPVLEVLVDTDPDTAEQRDPKGHYYLARRGLIDNFTAVTGPWQRPRQPDLVIDNVNQQLDHSVNELVQQLMARSGPQSGSR